MKINIEKMVDDLIEKIKSLINKENKTLEEKFEKQISDLKTKFDDFKIETIQKNHDIQIKFLENQLKSNNVILKEEIDEFTFDISFDEDTRTLTVKLDEQEKSIKIPTLIYHGVYDETKTYEKGDCITYSGSLWVCKKDNENSIKPGTEDGAEYWQLAVKKGSDAKNNPKK